MATATDAYMLKALALVNEHFPNGDVVVTMSPLGGIEMCVIYTRLSRQDDKSHSPETQLRLCRDTARHQKWKVLKEFTQDADEPISGKAFEQRPGWEALVAFIEACPEEKRRKTCVLVKAFDRFSRNLEEGLATQREFHERLGVRLRAVDTLYLAPESDEGWMTFVDLLKFAHFERLVTVKRTKQGLGTARFKGKHLGHFPRHFETNERGGIVPTKTALEIAHRRSAGESYDRIAKVVGVPKGEVWNVAVFLSRERSRREAVEIAA